MAPAFTAESKAEAKLEADPQSSTLIPSEKVAGASVFNPAGESLGSIYDIMIDKKTGKVAYAVMSFGGFLGMGEKYHPLPWSLLKYDTTLGGYVVDLDKRKLEGAPSYEVDASPSWTTDYNENVYNYYGTPPYWAGPIL